MGSLEGSSIIGVSDAYKKYNKKFSTFESGQKQDFQKEDISFHNFAEKSAMLSKDGKVIKTKICDVDIFAQIVTSKEGWSDGLFLSLSLSRTPKHQNTAKDAMSLK